MLFRFTAPNPVFVEVNGLEDCELTEDPEQYLKEGKCRNWQCYKNFKNK